MKTGFMFALSVREPPVRTKAYDQIVKQLADDGVRASRRRDAVLRAFAESGEHLTVDELYERARRIDPGVGYTTVWRTLKLLEAKGLASPHKFHDGFTRYERVGGERHHDHLICLSCGRVEEFVHPGLEALQEEVAREHRFRMTRHKMELYGCCRACAGRATAKDRS
jgi:Fur family transcriptional regulator, ferric uptake regulator